MFKEKVLAVRNLMVIGKLLILLSTNTAFADSLTQPRFFEYRGGSITAHALDFTFGWWKKLDDEQSDAYHQSILHALNSAENGQKVTWYKKDASGYAVPVATWPTGTGYCRRLYVQAIAYGVEKNMKTTACFDNTIRNWQWITQ